MGHPVDFRVASDRLGPDHRMDSSLKFDEALGEFALSFKRLV